MRAARRAAPAFLLAGALHRCAAQTLNSGLSFTIDERHGGLRNNPNLIVFIVLLSMALCVCGMCAVGFGKWDWLRVLIKGEEPTEVDLLGPPPPEPQGGGGNWVVRPRMETPLDCDGASVGPDARAQRSGLGGSVAGASEYGAGVGAEAVEEATPPPDSSPEAAAAWLLRVRGRPLAAPPACGTLSAATPSETLSSCSAGSSLSEEASTSAPPSSDKRSASSRRSRRPQPAAVQPPLPPEVEEARAFVAFAQRRPLPASTTSGSSFWSRASGGSDAVPRAGGFWARLRGRGSGRAQQQPPADAPRDRGESGERRRRSRSRRDADGRRMPPDDRV